jgi:hypothetical protein
LHNLDARVRCFKRRNPLAQPHNQMGPAAEIPVLNFNNIGFLAAREHDEREEQYDPAEMCHNSPVIE